MNKQTIFSLLAGIVLLSAILLPTQAAFQTVEPGRPDPAEKTVPSVRPLVPAAEKLGSMAQTKGAVPLIVGVKTDVPFVPEGKRTTPSSVQRQRRAINDAQERLLDSLSDFSIAVSARYKYIPYVALTVDEAGLEALLDSPLVTSVHEDSLSAPLLDSSIPVIGADDVWAAGYDGSGWAIAVLDTGIQWDHEFFGGISSSRVISEACYSKGEYWWKPGAKGSLCAPEPHPADVNTPQCWYGELCGHGTHVAGIAAGSSASATVAYDGVAPGADIIAIQIFSYFEETYQALSWDSDQLLALERVYDMSFTYNIAAVNMSLGGGYYTDYCDSNPLKAAIDNLRSVEIATIIVTGNENYTDGINQPACISSAIAVGATQDDDTIAGFSNSSEMVDLLAPGVGVNSSIPDNTYAIKDGTSMAAPHVAGAWALLKQADPAATVDDILAVLQNTGAPVTDTRNGVTKPRIQVDAALSHLMGGILSGAVKEDTGGYPPIAGAVVSASNPTYTLQTTTDASGAYRLRVPVGTYTVTAATYGYPSVTATGLSVSSGATITQDFTLTAYTSYYTVSGAISDANTGWPLYASIAVAGAPFGPPERTFWNDPVTGQYSLTLAEATTYTFDVSGWADGYSPVTRTVGPLTMDTAQDFALEADLSSCTAPGYTRQSLVSEDFETWPLSDWSIVDNAGNGCVWYGDDALEDWPEGNYTGGSGNFADADSEECGAQNMDTELISPPFDASPYGAVLVDFLHDYFRPYGSANIADVDIYDGANWNTVWTVPGNFAFGPVTVSGASSAADTRVRFHYYNANDDYHWQVDKVRISGTTCALPTVGGLVVGNVYDNNTGNGLDGATVSNESGYSTTTGPTPNPSVEEGFYTLFSPQGSRVLTATKSGYTSDVQTMTVPLNGVVWQDFTLEAPAIAVTPSSLSVMLGGMATSVQTLTITNTGTLDLDWDIGGGSHWYSVSPPNGMLAPGSRTVVSVTFDSAGVKSGAHSREMYITSTAPANSWIEIPLTLIVESNTLQGRVTEVGSGAPINKALVTADPGDFTTSTDANGDYSYYLPVYEGYTVTVESLWHESDEVTGVNISQDVSTTLDFQLTPIPTASVDGTVRDGSGHGWPLYARLKVKRNQFDNEFFTHPASGYYSITLPQGLLFTFTVSAESNSYIEEYIEVTRVITPGATEHFTLSVDTAECRAPGYAHPSIVSFDFEADDGGFVANTPPGEWEWGIPSYPAGIAAHSGTKVWGTNLVSNTIGDAGPHLLTKTLTLPSGSPLLGWWDWYDTGWSGNRRVWIDGDAVYDGFSDQPYWDYHKVDLSAWAGLTVTIVFDLTISDGDSSPDGWYIDDVSILSPTCQATPGGLLVGNVYDLSTGDGLDDAKVASIHNAADATETWDMGATWDDPAVGAGFYILFSSLTGTHPFEASAPGYTADRKTPTIVADGVATQDFYLLYRECDVFLPVILRQVTE